MKTPSYLARLTFAARWMLPPAEADEVVSDYADLLEGDDRTSEALCRDFGRPWKAVGLLCQPNSYRNWLILFCIMAALSIIPACTICFPWLFPWGLIHFLSSPLPLLIAVFPLALLSFQRFGAEKKPLSPSFYTLTVLLIFLGVCVVSLTAFCTSPSLPQWMENVPFEIARRLGSTVSAVLGVIALLSVLAGLWALVLARVRDRRWRALYFLALVVLTITLSLYHHLHNMTFYASGGNWTGPTEFIRIVQLAVFGLAGTGALLC